MKKIAFGILASVMVLTATTSVNAASMSTTGQERATVIEIDASKLIQNHMVSYSKSYYHNSADLPRTVWYEKDGFGGYLDFYYWDEFEHRFNAYYKGWVYSYGD